MKALLKKIVPFVLGLAFLLRAMQPPNIFNLIPAEIHRSLFRNVFPEVVTIFLFNFLIAFLIYWVSKKLITGFAAPKTDV
ncbi:MAG TPA: hypothetical protein DCL80_03880 [Balneola sp.]|jgi:membrane protein insertase Oxa1/YidC/SpoIIIJ|nr:hypothetical protein [Balneola sp.]MBR9918316.1 hypothetical protein [bacterium]MAO77330.1 hypothetical protein [Balneola sp.]HAH50433.1 hypothetical protein [Balneola sp.]HAW81930.1 hypothetical protein [Balneola sp.]|tara:strand:+ start:5298 stop:5537 length:240 start_codon:yes stop_codon:yes gene_type:complete